MADLLCRLDMLTNDLRVLNCILGIFGLLILVLFYARPRWPYWEVKERLVWMSHVCMCGVLSYGSIEAVFLNIQLRAPLATVSVIFLIIAYFWPKDKGA